MFNLNFISNPGMQSESSNESWSYVIEKNSLKPDEKSVLDKTVISSKRRNIWKYLITALFIITCILVIIKFSSPIMKPNIVLNNIIDIIVESEHNINFQLAEINFLFDNAKVLIRSKKIEDLQIVLEEYYLQKHMLYELYHKNEYNYISIIFPWEIATVKKDIYGLIANIKKTKFSNLIISSTNEAVIEMQGESTDIISFLLYMTESNQIQNYYYSILHNEHDNFKLKISVDLL